MKKLLLTLMLAVVSSSAMTGWTKAGSSVEKIIYVDFETIRKSGNNVKIWTLYDYKEPKKLKKYGSYMSVKYQEEHDCKNEQTKILYNIAYTGNMGGGDTIFSNKSEPDWSGK